MMSCLEALVCRNPCQSLRQSIAWKSGSIPRTMRAPAQDTHIYAHNIYMLMYILYTLKESIYYHYVPIYLYIYIYMCIAYIHSYARAQIFAQDIHCFVHCGVGCQPSTGK